MGAIASLDVLGVGSSIELAAQDGQRVIATGVDSSSAGGGTAKTVGDFVQPAVGSTVDVTITTLKGFERNGFTSVDGGGHYVTTLLPGGNVLRLGNPGGTPNAAPGTTIPAGAAVSVQAPSVMAQYGMGPYALEPVNNPLDPIFGAVGDDTTDDIAAFEACGVAAALNGYDIFVATPPAKFLLSRTWTPPRGVTIRGTATALGQCTIRCSAVGAAVVSLHTTGPTTDGTTLGIPSSISRVTLEGAGPHDLTYGLARNGDSLCRIREVFCKNCLDGDHANGHRLPVIIGPVTPGGGAPAGFTVTQPDPGYIGVSTGTIEIKVTGGGTTYVASFNGGPFATATQNTVPSGPSGLMVTQLGAFVASSGLLLHFPAGPFADDFTWTWSVTIQNEDNGEAHAINVEAESDECESNTCGIVPVEAGTVTVNVGSIVVEGFGTTWLTGPNPRMRPGDSITITLANIAGPGRNVGTYPVMGVGDDNTLYLYPGEGNLVQASGSALPYHRAIGYGIYEDDSGDMVRNRRRGGRLSACANGWRFTGDVSGGQFTLGPRIESGLSAGTGIGILCGGVLTAQQDALLLVPEIKSGLGCRLYFPAGSSTTVLAPRQSIFPNDPTSCYGAAPAILLISGVLLRYYPPGVAGGTIVGGGSSVPALTAQYIENLVDVNPGDQLVPPDQLSPTPLNTTNTVVNPSADCVGNLPLTLGAPKEVGLWWWIQVGVNSNFVVAIDDASVDDPKTFLSSGRQVLAAGERILVVSVQSITAFTPVWQQFGPVQRLYTGSRGKASQSGDGSGYVITVGTTPGVLGVWDLTFGGEVTVGGFLVNSQVAVRDTGNTDRAFFFDVRVAIDSSPALIGSTVIGASLGTNAGAPPAGYSVAYVIVDVGGGDLQLHLVATGPAGRTLKWFQTSVTTSVIRT